MVNSLTFRQIERVKVLQAQAAKVGARMADFERKASAEVAEMGIARHPHHSGRGEIINDTWNDNARRAELDRRLSAHRKQLVAEVEDKRRAAKVGLKTDADLMASVRSAWDDPVALLHRSTLGESSRRIYKDNLADCQRGSGSIVIMTSDHVAKM